MVHYRMQYKHGELSSYLNTSIHSYHSFIRKKTGLFAHVIISVNSLCLLYVPVVTMVTNVSSPVHPHCMAMNAVMSVRVVLMATVHLRMDHVIVMQVTLVLLATQVCYNVELKND